METDESSNPEGTPPDGWPLPETLPVLALRNTVLFPNLIAPVLAPSERARRLVDDAQASDALLVAVAARDPQSEEPGPDELYRVGTAVRILRVLDARGGGRRLYVQGLRRVHIEQYVETEPYLRARIAPVVDDVHESLELEALQRNVSAQFLALTEDSSSVPEAVRSLVSSVDDPVVLGDHVAAHLALSVADRQGLLETANVRERLVKLSEHLAREREVRRLEQEIREEVQEELTRSQREYVLREQARAIRRQLGEGTGPAELVDELRARIEKAAPPEAVRARAETELNRLGALPPGAMEASTLRSYLEWIADLPWNTESDDELDVKRAREVLDEDHYDLEKVKERILEFIAVLRLKKDLRGPILCFAGPPGTGKTSLGRSIARAMGRQFARMALGGVRDEAEIRGHRRTYVGSLPGRVIQTIKRVGTRNPVLMLDEIDKLGTDFRGDPASALLEVLDPEHNAAFSDHYLEVPFDLSKVLFIATANLLEPIPPALRDRMEVIEVPGYVEEDKLAIARRHLLPRQLEQHGLKGVPEFTDAALAAIIRSYTREAGLRNLERELGKIARKLARRLVDEGEIPDVLGPEDLRPLLGPERFESELAGHTQAPGVAIGLAWTQYGGEILFIEATRMAGDAKVQITGSLGSVMRESVETALALVRSRGEELGIEASRFESDLHVHVPSGATPKDGPSAGVAITVALTSLLLERPVAPDLAMTGEITLRGRVLPVGGVKEKVLAARRGGVARVILPEENLKDLADVPDSRLAGLEIIGVQQVDDVLRIAFPGESPS